MNDNHDSDVGHDEEYAGDDQDDRRQPVLVRQLIRADEERRRLRESGNTDWSTIQLSDELTPQERDELEQMLQCADELEHLASQDCENSWSTPVADERDTCSDTDDYTIPEDHRIGPYRVLQRIADGGFGAVLLGIDERNDRQVAIKVPRPDIVFTSRLQERFLIEGRAAGTLDHPNIVAVYETLSKPVPAIAFEYCDGGTLSQAATDIKDERTAIQVVLCLAEALQHAHTRGVLHRDVKPGNVLLVHSREGHQEHAVAIGGKWLIPKLGDFGLAKLLDESIHQTQTGVVMGTPQFMAPEQAAGRASELGTHTDVFSLGAIFYWLLVGHPPFEGHGTLQTLKLVETMDAEPPRRVRRNISPKTEAVCLKCLRKPIDARYQSAAALAEDLRHLLLDEPVSVRPPSVVERLRAWRRRNPALAVFAIMLPLAAALGLLVQWSNNQALQEYVDQLDAANDSLVERTQQARDAQMLAERRGYASDLQLAQRAFEAGDLKTYREALIRHRPDSPQATDLRGPEWQELWDRGHPPPTPIEDFRSPIYCANLSADGDYLVASGADATIRVYDTSTWNRVKTIASGQGEVNYASFSSDGALIASAGDDGTIKIWNWREETQTLQIQAYDDVYAFCVKFYDDDKALASCGRHEVARLWNAESGELKADLIDDTVDGRLEQIDISDNGRWLAAAAFDGRRRVWDLRTTKLAQNRDAIDGKNVTSVCLFDRDGETWMLSGTDPEESRGDCSLILEVIGEDNERTLPIHFDGISAVAADAGGQLAVAGDDGGRISLIDLNAAIRGKRWWNPQTVRKSWVGHSGKIYGLTITADGRTVISAGKDGQLLRWDLNQLSGSSTLSARTTSTWIHAAAAADQSVFLVDDEGQLHNWHPQEDRLVQIVEAETGEPLLLEPRSDRAGGSLATFDTRLVARSQGGPVCCWDIKDNTARHVWSAQIDDLPDGERAGFYAIAVSSDRKNVAICRRGHPVHNFVVDARTGAVLHKIPVAGGVDVGCRAIAFNEAGTHLAFGNEEDVFVHNLETDEQTHLKGHAGHIRAVCFVPGSDLLVSGALDRRIVVWNLSTGESHELAGHRAPIDRLSLHPHTDRLISSDLAGWVHIWSLDEGMLLTEVPPPADQTRHASLGADVVGIVGQQSVFRKQLPSPR